MKRLSLTAQELRDKLLAVGCIPVRRPNLDLIKSKLGFATRDSEVFTIPSTFLAPNSKTFVHVGRVYVVVWSAEQFFTFVPRNAGLRLPLRNVDVAGGGSQPVILRVSATVNRNEADTYSGEEKEVEIARIYLTRY
jgi:hypothetical protein